MLLHRLRRQGGGGRRGRKPPRLPCPVPRQGALQAPWNPLLNSYKISYIQLLYQILIIRVCMGPGGGQAPPLQFPKESAGFDIIPLCIQKRCGRSVSECKGVLAHRLYLFRYLIHATCGGELKVNGGFRGQQSRRPANPGRGFSLHPLLNSYVVFYYLFILKCIQKISRIVL